VILTAALIVLTAAAAGGDIQPNDNTRPAGRLEDGRLTVHLVVSAGQIRPQGPNVTAQKVAAFGEDGQPPSAPGPLIRVVAGTVISATIRNTLSYDLTIHGFCDRQTRCTPFVVGAGASRTVRVAATTPGTYTYWAAPGTTELGFRLFPDSVLGGVIVIDPPGGSPPDRIFVLSILTDAAHPDDLTIPFLPLLNGASWPYTERLHLAVGKTVRFRVVNLSSESHAMHLHGFHFEMRASGDGLTDRPLTPSERRLEVTERIGKGRTFAMQWTPTRPGNWLFHCHMVSHMTPDENSPQSHDPDDMKTAAGMSGLVLGMIVTGPAADAKATPAAIDTATMRIERQDEKYDKHPGYTVTFPGRDAPIIGDKGVPGPVLVVERGRPTAITIENRTPDPTAIHWHGIEIESYYDGVPNFGGMGSSITPAIVPGGDFVARFTPPRAGTYIYHTHWHDLDQLSGGLYGAVVVLEPGQRFDPAVDHVVVLGLTHVAGVEEPVMLNGSLTPAPIVLRTGAANRLRLINITGDNVDLVVRLVDDGETSTWTPRARDGAALPMALQVLGPARMQLTVGNTFDAEIAPSGPRKLWLEVRRGNSKWEIQAPVEIR
jgi:FtsP/CotA-like multicopper oxidase with cupredoxin domain